MCCSLCLPQSAHHQRISPIRTASARGDRTLAFRWSEVLTEGAGRSVRSGPAGLAQCELPPGRSESVHPLSETRFTGVYFLALQRVTTTDQSGTLAMASNTTAACDLLPGSSTPFGQHPARPHRKLLRSQVPPLLCCIHE